MVRSIHLTRSCGTKACTGHVQFISSGGPYFHKFERYAVPRERARRSGPFLTFPVGRTHRGGSTTGRPFGAAGRVALADKASSAHLDGHCARLAAAPMAAPPGSICSASPGAEPSAPWALRPPPRRLSCGRAGCDRLDIGSISLAHSRLRPGLIAPGAYRSITRTTRGK